MLTREAEVIEAVQAARAARQPFAIVGSGSKRALGRAIEAPELDVSGLAGITDYRPEELILTAKPGTPVSEIEAALAAKNQRLGFAPPDWGSLLGKNSGGTIGGAISADLNGSARIRHGAVRDHLLGIRAVNGFGEAFKAGGKVVKNVTGFDIPKLVCGGFGTLCVLTEVTLRVFPKPPREAGFVIEAPEAVTALAVLRRLWASALEPSGLAYLPRDIARGSGFADGVALVRLEGAPNALAEKRMALGAIAAGAHEIDDTAIFSRIGSGGVFVDNDLDVWRVAVPPSRAAEAIAALAPSQWLADWAGGMLWVGFAQTPETIHTVVAAHEGHATRMRGAKGLAPFPLPDAARLAKTRAVKAAFDPLGLFNPGRMYEGV